MSQLKQIGSKILNRVATLGICPEAWPLHNLLRVLMIFLQLGPGDPDFPLFAPSCCCWKWKCPSEWSDRCRALLAEFYKIIFVSHKAVVSNLGHDGISLVPTCANFLHYFFDQRSPKRRPSILFLSVEGRQWAMGTSRLSPVVFEQFLERCHCEVLPPAFTAQMRSACAEESWSEQSANDDHRFFTFLIISPPCDHAASWFSGTNDHWFWFCPGGFCLHMHNTRTLRSHR